jgi:integrase
MAYPDTRSDECDGAGSGQCATRVRALDRTYDTEAQFRQGLRRTLHDLRRIARSLMSRAGVPSEHAMRYLGHVIGGVRGIYDRHKYYDEKKLAFEKLATLVESIVDPKENVLPMKGKKRRT